MRYLPVLPILCLWGCSFEAPAVPGGDGAPPPDSAPATDAAPPDAACGAFCDYARRRQLTIDNTGISEELLNIPILIKLSAERIDYAAAQPDGDDLRFVMSDHTTELAYEIESWEAGGLSLIWVKVPRLPPASEGKLTLWMYYGNAGAAAGQSAASVWDNGFVSVHHLHGNTIDATGSGHDGTLVGPPMPSEGKVGEAYMFDGSDDYITLPSEGDYDFIQMLSVSLWFQATQLDLYHQTLVAKGDNAWRIQRFEYSQFLSFSTTRSGAFGHHDGVGDVAVGDNMWHHVLVSYDGMYKRMYIDGELDYESRYSESLNEADALVQFGANSDESNRYFEGLIDEVRIAGVPRSGAWALVEYRSVNDDTFVTFNDEEVLGTRR